MFTRHLSHFFLFRQHLKTRTNHTFPTTFSKNLFRFPNTTRTKPSSTPEQKSQIKCLISMSIYSIIIVSVSNVSSLTDRSARKLFNTSRRREPHRKVGSMNTEYLQRIINDPNSSREDYMWAWSIMQDRVQEQHKVNAAADKHHTER